MTVLRNLRVLRPLAAAAAFLAPLVAGAAPPPAAAPKPAVGAAAPAGSKTAALPPGLAALKASPFFTFEKYKLANGLEVILQEDHRVPLVAVNVRYRVGSKDEITGKTGFAHLFEHLMFQGSRNVGEDLFFKYLQEAGSSNVNGTTNTDRTNYFEQLPSSQLALALWLESDRMGFLLDHVNEKTLGEQRDVVKNERRQRYENVPYGLGIKALVEALYPKDHPYHHLTIGDHADLDAASLEDVKAFFRQYYVPANATLVLVGDFETSKAKEQVEAYFGPLAAGPAPSVKRTPVPVTLTGEKRVALEAGVELPRLSVVWPGVPVGHPDAAALDLASDVLADGRGSRLYQKVVREKELASSISAASQDALLAGTFMTNATVFAGKTPDAVLAVVDAEVERLAKTGPTAAELARAKARTITGAMRSFESVLSRAEALNSGNDMAGDPAFGRTELERLAAVTADDVKRVVHTYLATKNRLVITVVPNPSAPIFGRPVAGGSL